RGLWHLHRRHHRRHTGNATPWVMARLDLGVAPIANARTLARRDVACARNAPRSGELAAAFAQRALKIDAGSGRGERRVAFHAMGGGREIEAAFNADIGFSAPGNTCPDTASL